MSQDTSLEVSVNPSAKDIEVVAGLAAELALNLQRAVDIAAKIADLDINIEIKVGEDR